MAPKERSKETKRRAKKKNEKGFAQLFDKNRWGERDKQKRKEKARREAKTMEAKLEKRRAKTVAAALDSHQEENIWSDRE